MIFNTKHLLKTIAVGAFALTTAFSCPAYAQETITVPATENHKLATDRPGSGDSYDENGVPYTKKYFQGVGIYHTMALIRKPELGDDQFVIRFALPSTISTCVNISNFGFEASYTEHYMDITLNKITVDARDMPQYAHYECDLRSKMPHADILLDRQTLIDNGTKTLRLHSAERTNYYDLDLTENRVLILPDKTDVQVGKAFRPAKLPMRNASTVYWFYPMGTLVLWSPQETDPKQTQKYIDTFAERHGLVPMTDYIENFKSPLYDKRFQYYVDASGKFDNVAGIEEGAQIGHTTVETVEYGLHGDEIGTKDIMIYARKPGMYD